jgi:hypothetical protein
MGGAAWQHRALLIAAAAALLGITFDLIRRRRLREEYAVLWVCTGIILLVFAVFPSALFILAGWLRLDRGILLTFVVGLFIAAIVLHYSVAISRHSDREKELVEEMALLKQEMEKVRGEVKEAQRPPPEPKPRPPALRT